jgi:hypothetical protein
MIPTQPMRSTGTCVVVACLATLALALAACSANPSDSPSPSGANGPQTIHLLTLGLHRELSG